MLKRKEGLSCSDNNKTKVLSRRTNGNLVPTPSPHLCPPLPLLRWRLLPIPQHLPHRTLPLPLQLVTELLDLILTRRPPAPSRWLSSLILRIVRDKLIILDLPQHQPSQIPAAVTLRISVYPALRLFHTVRAKRAVSRKSTQLSQQPMGRDVVRPCCSHGLGNVWRVQRGEGEFDSAQRGECVDAVLLKG